MPVKFGNDLGNQFDPDSIYDKAPREDAKITAGYLNRNEFIREDAKRKNVEDMRKKMIDLFSRYEKEIPADLLKAINSNLRIMIIEQNQALFDFYYSLLNKEDEIISERLRKELGEPMKAKDPLEDLL
jgi:hypothetical protein